MRTRPVPEAVSNGGKAAKAFDARVWLLSLGTFAIGTDAYVVAGILPQLAKSLNVSIGGAGQIITWYSLTYAICAPVLTALFGRMRREHIAIGALVAFLIANALCATSTTYSTVIAARIFAGMSAGLYVPTAYALAASLAREERKSAALAVVIS
jgi:predicted MFS family arabinose efflux permease